MRTRWVIWLLLLPVGCTGSRAVPEPDAQYGHRFEDPAPDGRRTVEITPAEGNERFRYYPASVEEVVVRPAPFDLSTEPASQEVSVEVLVKGALPDACMELHSFSQERTANIIRAELVMRRAEDAVCATVLRPFRFYVMLDGEYAVGHYTLRLNNVAYPFQVRVPS